MVQDGHGEVQLGIQTVRRSSVLPGGPTNTNNNPRSNKKLKKQHTESHTADSSPDGGLLCVILSLNLFSAIHKPEAFLCVDPL